MRPICVKCCKEMSCEKNGFIIRFIIKEQIAYDKRGDMYKCSNCGCQVVIGLGSADHNVSSNIADILVENY